MPWHVIKDENDRPYLEFELEKVVRGFFQPALFVDYIRHFVLFEEDGDKLIKKIAGYHQFHGVREAVRVTVIAANPDKPAGAVGEERATYGREVVPGSRKAASSGTLRGLARVFPCAATPENLFNSQRCETRHWW